MPVRMKDIARDLGVSVITVSKALRNHSDISPETRARVLKRVKELNYTPNLAARALVTGHTNLMGLVVPDLVHSFFAEMAKGLSSVLRDRGYSLVISSSEENPELEQKAIDQLLGRGVDVLLVASTQPTADGFRRVEEQKVPCILVDRCFSEFRANFVGVKDQTVGFLATEHLIQAGCRTIAHIGGMRISTAAGRMEGYRRALLQHGLQLRPQYIVTADRLDESADAAGYRSAMQLINLDPRPDGIFCFNDPVAVGAMKAILEAGIRIPEEIALIGCGNLRFDDALRVPLSSIDQKSEMIGQRAGRLAISLVEAESPLPPKAIFLEPKLVVRESTKRLR
jgi:LacI family transcriptional regulator